MVNKTAEGTRLEDKRFCDGENLGDIVQRMKLGLDVKTYQDFNILKMTIYGYNDGCAVYSISNMKNGKMYIGQTMSLHERFLSHIRDLCKNKHGCHRLQTDWNNFGYENFTFDVLEHFDDNITDIDLYCIEQGYLSCIPHDMVYNSKWSSDLTLYNKIYRSVVKMT